MATFRTNPVGLEDLLRVCEDGTIKLPDFQRSWVWDEERIRSLIASVSLAFPVGALMTLETGGRSRSKNGLSKARQRRPMKTARVTCCLMGSNA